MIKRRKIPHSTLLKRAPILYLIIWWIVSFSTYLLVYFNDTAQIALKVLVPLSLLFIIFREKSLRIDRGLWFYIGLAGWGCLSLLYSVNGNMTLRYLQMLLGNIVVWYITARCVRKIDNIKALLFPFLAVFLIQLYFLLTMKFQGPAIIASQGMERFKGLSSNSNDAGTMMVFGIVIVILLIFSTKNRTLKKLLWVTIPFFFAGIFKTGSRGGLLAAAGFLIVWIFLKTKKGNYGYLIISVILAYFLYHLGYNYFIDTTTLGRRFVVGSELGERNIRFHLIEDGWHYFLAHPLMGIGLGSFTTYTGSFYSHNDYIEILSSLGLPGFVIYMGIYMDYWRKIKALIRRKYDADKITTIILAFMFCYLILGMFNPSFYFLNTTMMFAFFYSLNCKMYYSFQQQKVLTNKYKGRQTKEYYYLEDKQ